MFKKIVANEWRIVLAHRKCNGRKGNRAPTACEVIFLMGVNAAHSKSADSKRTQSRAKRRRRQRARENVAKMQMELS